MLREKVAFALGCLCLHQACLGFLWPTPKKLRVKKTWSHNSWPIPLVFAKEEKPLEAFCLSIQSRVGPMGQAIAQCYDHHMLKGGSSHSSRHQGVQALLGDPQAGVKAWKGFERGLWYATFKSSVVFNGLYPKEFPDHCVSILTQNNSRVIFDCFFVH